MGIAMTFARVSGPGDLRTRRRGSRGDDGFPGRERRATDDRCRRSRDVGKLRRKSRIAVYRNVEMVFPFVLGKLGYRHMNKINRIINWLIYMVYYLSAFAILALVWLFLLLDPWLSILGLLGLTDQIENYNSLVRNLIELVPAMPLIAIIIYIDNTVLHRIYMNEE